MFLTRATHLNNKRKSCRTTFIDVGCSLEERRWAEAAQSETVGQAGVKSQPPASSAEIVSVTADSTVTNDVSPTYVVNADTMYFQMYVNTSVGKHNIGPVGQLSKKKFHATWVN